MRGSKTTIFGMITVSLDVNIVNVFIFTECNLSAFEQHSRFRHCVISIG